jgi:putative ABC transport system permease protein
MVREYMKMAVRQLLREKIFSLVNLAGLALGLACVICILLFVKDELSYDQHLSKKQRIFRVIQGGDSEEQSSSLPFPTGPTLINDFPGDIEKQVRLFNFQASTLSIVHEDHGVDIPFNEPHFFFADSTYFKIFDHKFINGSPDKALDGPSFVVITEPTAIRYFNSIDVVGRVIKFEGKHDLTITGVVEDVPSNSHFRFDFIASMTTLPAINFPIPEKNWYWNPVWTYVLLSDANRKDEVMAQLPAFVQKYYHPSIKDEVDLNLQPITDIYLYSRSDYEIGMMGSARNIKVFSIIGVVILLVAIINFINLSTARATDRFKEIGVRKVSGASRRRLLFQFLTESVVVIFISLLLAGVLAAMLLGPLNKLADKTFSLTDLFQMQTLLIMVAIALTAGVLSGIYPAMYLSSLNPVNILKSGGASPGGKSFSRKALTVFQFATSTILIVVTMVIYSQVNFMKDAPLGFDQEQILVLPVQRSSLVPNYELFKDQLLANDAITSVSSTNTLLGKDYQSSNYKKEGQEEMSFYPCLFVRMDFAKTIGVKLLAGRDFNDEITAPGYYAMINQSLCKVWGWTPEEAIGQKITGTVEGEMTVVGVTEDFHYAPLKQTVGPLMMCQSDFAAKHRDFFTRFVMVRIKPEKARETLAFLSTTWSKLVTESPFDYFFLDEQLNTVYKQEDRLNQIATVFSAFAIVIGCLGLYGLSLFTFRKRRKEVAIRKVLGASETVIVRLFTVDFLKLVVIGFTVGAPAAYVLSEKWLSEYSYRMPLSQSYFIICFGILLFLAMFTISFQTIQASVANPSDALRSE